MGFSPKIRTANTTSSPRPDMTLTLPRSPIHSLRAILDDYFTPFPYFKCWGVGKDWHMTPLDLHSPRDSLASSPTSPQGRQGSRNIYTDCKIWHTSPWGGGTRWMPRSACAIENYSKSIWKTKVAVWVIHFRESGSPRDFPADKCLLISTVAAEEWGKDHNEGMWGFPGDLGVISSNRRINIDDKETSELI